MDLNTTIVLIAIIIVIGIIAETALVFHSSSNTQKNQTLNKNISSKSSSVNSTGVIIKNVSKTNSTNSTSKRVNITTSTHTSVSTVTTSTSPTTIKSTVNSTSTTSSTTVETTSTTTVNTSKTQTFVQKYPVNATLVDQYLGGTWTLTSESNITSSLIPGNLWEVIENFTNSNSNKKAIFAIVTQKSNENATENYNNYITSLYNEAQVDSSEYKFSTGSLPNTLSYFIFNGTVQNSTGGSLVDNFINVDGIFQNHIIIEDVSNMSNNVNSMGYYSGNLIAGLSVFENSSVYSNNIAGYQRYITNSLISNYFGNGWIQTGNGTENTSVLANEGRVSGEYFNFTNSTYNIQAVTINFNNFLNASNSYNNLLSEFPSSNVTKIYQATLDGFSYVILNTESQKQPMISGFVVINNNIVAILTYPISSNSINVQGIDNKINQYLNSFV